jgi:cytochrome P450
MLYEEIGERRRSGQRGADVLSLLLDSHYDDGAPMPTDAIRDHMRSLLFAGHETTMTTIAWVMHYLHANPDALERTRAEILADPDLGRNHWLDAVVCESLRVKPIILGVVRKLAEDMVLGDYDAPAGTRLNVSIVMLHSDPQLYPDPDAFRPERFLEQRPKPWEYAPFGGGRHRCLGATFAQFEAKVVVATLLRHFRFELAGPHEPEVIRRNLSMAPRGGIPLRVVERLV